LLRAVPSTLIDEMTVLARSGTKSAEAHVNRFHSNYFIRAASVALSRTMAAMVWDATVFCKNRDRLLDGDIAAMFFASVLNLPRVRRPLVPQKVPARKPSSAT
jgi:hypothetical protein